MSLMMRLLKRVEMMRRRMVNGVVYTVDVEEDGLVDTKKIIIKGIILLSLEKKIYTEYNEQ